MGGGVSHSEELLKSLSCHKSAFFVARCLTNRVPDASPKLNVHIGRSYDEKLSPEVFYKRCY